jgi:hypothetical protein
MTTAPSGSLGEAAARDTRVLEEVLPIGIRIEPPGEAMLEVQLEVVEVATLLVGAREPMGMLAT